MTKKKSTKKKKNKNPKPAPIIIDSANVVSNGQDVEKTKKGIDFGRTEAILSIIALIVSASLYIMHNFYELRGRIRDLERRDDYRNLHIEDTNQLLEKKKQLNCKNLILVRDSINNLITAKCVD